MHRTLLLISLCLLATTTHAGSGAWSGHVDLVNKYYVRGITTTYGNLPTGFGNRYADAPESDKATLQWGLDYSHDSGWYAGYWGSQVNFSYDLIGKAYDQYVRTGTVSIDDYQDGPNSLEHDLYAGYRGQAGDLGYEVGLIGYLYSHSRHSAGMETKLGVSYRGFSLAAQTLVNDAVWGNQGDTYWTLAYSHALPHDLTLTGTLGAYTYAKEGKYIGTRDPRTGTDCPPGTAFFITGCVAGSGPVGGGFRHFTLALSQPIGDSGFTWSLQAILGGDNRWGMAQGERLMASLSYQIK
ncbi:MAG: TorF family putative porin [Pseudomonadota bacterium]